MAGFMAGFGAAFSESYNRAAQNRANAEQDAFKMYYDDYLSRRQEKEKYDREDAKISKQAKSLAPIVGLDFEAVDTMLRSGMSADDIQKYVENGGTANVDRSTAAQGPDVNAVDPAVQQTNDMMTPGGTQTPQAPQPGGILSKVFGPRQITMDKARDKIAQLEGISSNDVEATRSFKPKDGLTSQDYKIDFKPGKKEIDGDKINRMDSPEELTVQIQQAQLKGDTAKVQQLSDLRDQLIQLDMDKIAATGKAKAIADGTDYNSTSVIVRTPDGKLKPVAIGQSDGQSMVDTNGQAIDPASVVRRVDKTEAMDRYQLVKDMKESTTNYSQQVGDYLSVKKDYQDLSKILQQNPGALSLSGDIASIATRLEFDASNTLQLLDSRVKEAVANGDLGSSTEAEIDAYTQKLESLLGNKIQDEAAANALAEAKMIKIAFNQAKTINGGKPSNADFDNALKIIRANGRPEQINQLANSWISNQKAALDNQYQTLMNTGFAAEFQDRYGYVPSTVLKPVDEYDQMNSQAGTTTPTQPDVQLPQGWTDSGKLTPDGRKIYLDANGKQKVLKQ